MYQHPLPRVGPAMLLIAADGAPELAGDKGDEPPDAVRPGGADQRRLAFLPAGRPATRPVLPFPARQIVFRDCVNHFRIGRVLPADYDDFAYEDDDDYDNEVYVVNCPSCDESVNLTERELEEGSIVCPHCGELLEFNYDDIEQDFQNSDGIADDADSEGDAE